MLYRLAFAFSPTTPNADPPFSTFTDLAARLAVHLGGECLQVPVEVTRAVAEFRVALSLRVDADFSVLMRAVMEATREDPRWRVVEMREVDGPPPPPPSRLPLVEALASRVVVPAATPKDDDDDDASSLDSSVESGKSSESDDDYDVGVASGSSGTFFSSCFSPSSTHPRVPALSVEPD